MSHITTCDENKLKLDVSAPKRMLQRYGERADALKDEEGWGGGGSTKTVFVHI